MTILLFKIMVFADNNVMLGTTAGSVLYINEGSSRENEDSSMILQEKMKILLL